MSRGAGGEGKVVFTPTGKQYQVKVNITLNDLRQALALRRIVSAFEASVARREVKIGKLG